jgi:hypothetical protein
MKVPAVGGIVARIVESRSQKQAWRGRAQADQGNGAATIWTRRAAAFASIIRGTARRSAMVVKLTIGLCRQIEVVLFKFREQTFAHCPRCILAFSYKEFTIPFRVDVRLLATGKVLPHRHLSAHGLHR